MATQSSLYGAYVPTTNIWDPQIIYSSNLQPELKEILVRMYQNLSNMSNVLNVKSTGQFNNSFETVNGNQWFPDPALNSNSTTTPTQRPEYMSVYNFNYPTGLPVGTTSIAHGLPINTQWTFTQIYGTASDTTGFNYYPIGAGSATTIAMNIDAVNINITNGTGISFDTCYVVLKYLKS